MFNSNSNPNRVIMNNPNNMRDQQIAQWQSYSNLSNQMPYQMPPPMFSNASVAMMQNQQIQQIQPTLANISPFSSKKIPIYPKADPFYDQPIEIKGKTNAKDIKPCSIQIEMRACLSPVILDKVKRVPGTCSLKTSGGDRTGVDLVCVIDVSGSMGGQKIDLVKQTLLYIIDLLNENDRLSLITFTGSANKLAHLVRVNETHKPSLKHIMSNIQAGGGTAISSGLQAALDTLGERKHVNSVSSVFLLSDGEDGTLEECRNLLSKKSSGVYTLHSFGFGKDHDSNLLTELASQKDGNFYYIPKIEKVDQAFVNALGALFSVVAEKVNLLIQQTAQGQFSGIRIAKTYGQMWTKTSNGYTISLSQLISNVSKDFVFELEIPVNNLTLNDTIRTQQVLVSKFQAITPSKEKLSGIAELNLTLFNAKEAPEMKMVQDPTALANYLRAKTAECIQSSMKLANSRQFSKAQANLNNMVKEVELYPHLDPKLIKPILESLKQTLSSCQEHVYSQVGQGVFNNCQYQLMNQNNAMFSNPMQCAMDYNLQQQKY